MIDVFLGPTVPVREAAMLVDATFHGPAALGDVYQAVEKGARTVVLIDGTFETGPAVWHKEIHWALTRGATVVGAASMGALRAVELEPCGMIGVGEIYEAFRSGRLTDDDEVAVRHASAAHDYRSLSEALVNIRGTIWAAYRSGLASFELAETLIRLAKRLFYPDRSYPQLLKLAGAEGIDSSRLSRLAAWIKDHAVDAKRHDAIRAFNMVASNDLTALPSKVRFEHTRFWEDARQECDRRASGSHE